MKNLYDKFMNSYVRRVWPGNEVDRPVIHNLFNTVSSQVTRSIGWSNRLLIEEVVRKENE